MQEKKDIVDEIESQLEYELGKEVNPTKAITNLIKSAIMGIGKLLFVVSVGFTCYFMLTAEWESVVPKLMLIPQAVIATIITVKAFVDSAVNNLTKGEKQ